MTVGVGRAHAHCAGCLEVTYDVFIFGLALSIGVFAFVLIRR
jgi:hypothetical protein